MTTIIGCRPPAGILRSDPVRNVIVITVDTLRADHLGMYGYPLPTSPVLDRWTRNGHIMIRCVANVPKTAPSLAGMLTSTLPERHLVIYNEQIIEESLVTLPEQLARSGLDIFRGGIQVNNLCRTECGFERGFNEYIQTCRWGEFQQPGMEIEHINNVVLPWIRNHADMRFFLWVHYMDPHGPYQPPAPFDSMFEPERYPVPVPELEVGTHNRGYRKIPRYQSVIGSTRLQDYIARYDGEIRYWDHHFEAVLRELDRLNLSGTTAVIVTADHGESLVEHEYYFEHGAFLYDQGLHIPCLINLPGTTGNRLVGGQCSLLDIAPTVLELFHADPLPEAMGASLVPCLTGRVPHLANRPVAIRSSEPTLREYASRGYTDGIEKYIVYDDPTSRKPEFFNLETDTLESRNTASGTRWLKKRKIESTWRGCQPDLPANLREPKRAPELLNHQEVQILESLGYIETN